MTPCINKACMPCFVKENYENFQRYATYIFFVVDRDLCCFQIENELCCNFSRGVCLLQVANHRRMTHDSELNGC